MVAELMTAVSVLEDSSAYIAGVTSNWNQSLEASGDIPAVIKCNDIDKYISCELQQMWLNELRAKGDGHTLIPWMPCGKFSATPWIQSPQLRCIPRDFTIASNLLSKSKMKFIASQQL